MSKVNRAAGALAISSILLLVIGVALPSRVSAQTHGQGQAVGILILLGLASRPAAQPPAEAKKPDGVLKKAAQTPGKLIRLTSDRLNGRMVVGSAEASDSPPTK
jgi:hypothetical protein